MILPLLVLTYADWGDVRNTLQYGEVRKHMQQGELFDEDAQYSARYWRSAQRKHECHDSHTRMYLVDQDQTLLSTFITVFGRDIPEKLSWLITGCLLKDAFATRCGHPAFHVNFCRRKLFHLTSLKVLLTHSKLCLPLIMYLPGAELLGPEISYSQTCIWTYFVASYLVQRVLSQMN